jgi:hypothetical protein
LLSKTQLKCLDRCTNYLYLRTVPVLVLYICGDSILSLSLSQPTQAWTHDSFGSGHAKYVVRNLRSLQLFSPVSAVFIPFTHAKWYSSGVPFCCLSAEGTLKCLTASNLKPPNNIIKHMGQDDRVQAMLGPLCCHCLT